MSDLLQAAYDETAKELMVLQSEIVMIKAKKEHYLTQYKKCRIERENLEKEIVIARSIFNGIEKVTDIWLPGIVDEEHKGEAIALHNFRDNYLEFIELTKDRVAR